MRFMLVEFNELKLYHPKLITSLCNIFYLNCIKLCTTKVICVFNNMFNLLLTSSDLVSEVFQVIILIE